MKIVTLLSGGLDSTTLLYSLKDSYPDAEITALSFLYGQRHAEREHAAAIAVAKAAGIEHHTVHLMASINTTPETGWMQWGDLGELFDTSLTGQKDVPDGHYADENMKQTVVPNRNATFLAIAYGVALSKKAELVAFGAHAGDHTIYPDCRPEFVEALSEAFEVGARWTPDEEVPTIIAPFIDWSKADIAKRASQLGVPIAETWSCYKGGDIHCGTCGTCYERREAFKVAGVEDPTKYLDSVTEFAAP